MNREIKKKMESITNFTKKKNRPIAYIGRCDQVTKSVTQIGFFATIDH